ncbi:MAG: hypothetical protein AB7F43_07380 [Bacteriovoracia bacterium]
MKCGSGCWVTTLLMGLGWLLFASALLTVTWNKVIAAHFSKIKTAKYWQALLLIFTVVALCAPRCYLRSRCTRGQHCAYASSSCCQKKDCKDKDCKSCDDCDEGKTGGECPHKKK